MFRNHFLSPIDPRLSPDFAFGATDTTKKISSGLPKEGLESSFED